MKIKWKELVTLDFETYYDTVYSLRNKDYNTSEYIRDPQFLTQCVGIKRGKTKAKWYDPDEGRRILTEEIDWENSDILAHNTAFDGLILSHHYGIVLPKHRMYFDTLSMTRGLHSEISRAALDKIAKFYGIGAKHIGALDNVMGVRVPPAASLKKLGEYCANDVELCFDVFSKQIEVFPDNELKLIDLTMRMFIDPVLSVDMPRAQAALAEEIMQRLHTINLSGATETDLNSNAKFAELLRKEGIDPPTKISLKTGQENYAFAQTDPEFTDLLEHENVKVVRLAQARLNAKSTIGETRAQRFINAGCDKKKLPVMLNYYGAKTGRWSGGNKMNMQNLPRGGELRRSILAPRGHKVVVADSAQIEARVNAWLAGQEDVLDAFRNGRDIYSEFASTVYGRTITKKDVLERFVGKVAILGLGYQMGAPKFQATLALGMMGLPVELKAKLCKGVVTTYRKKNNKIAAQWQSMSNILLHLWQKKTGTYRDILEYEDNAIWMPNGMALQYPGLTAEIDIANDRVISFKYNSHGVWKHIYGGLLTENVVQALSRIIVAEQMLKVAENWRVVTMTHDEIVAVAPTKQADRCLNEMIDIMRTPPDWCENLPLNAEGGHDVCYSK